MKHIEVRALVIDRPRSIRADLDLQIGRPVVDRLQDDELTGALTGGDPRRRIELVADDDFPYSDAPRTSWSSSIDACRNESAAMVAVGLAVIRTCPAVSAPASERTSTAVPAC